ncbi:transglycosylase domain-containing protein [Vaginisenegalia massiliensis]|uniref:transglycosylase domain-containing protein n=1 Tax=Vaginisenegalia massiliensis TaxID=2058294 RepID=UPI001F152982|nr:transglycosylase domain-containing protein [Vaginisenegalia massiliensis]
MDHSKNPNKPKPNKQQTISKEGRTFYDASFDYPEDKTNPSLSKTRVKHRHSTSKWDDFYAQHRDKTPLNNFESNHRTKGADSKAASPTNGSTRPSRQERFSDQWEDDWHFQPSDSKPITQQSSLFLNHSLKRVKSFLDEEKKKLSEYQTPRQNIKKVRTKLTQPADRTDTSGQFERKIPSLRAKQTEPEQSIRTAPESREVSRQKNLAPLPPKQEKIYSNQPILNNKDSRPILPTIQTTKGPEPLATQSVEEATHIKSSTRSTQQTGLSKANTRRQWNYTQNLPTPEEIARERERRQRLAKQNVTKAPSLESALTRPGQNQKHSTPDSILAKTVKPAKPVPTIQVPQASLGKSAKTNLVEQTENPKSTRVSESSSNTVSSRHYQDKMQNDRPAILPTKSNLHQKKDSPSLLEEAPYPTKTIDKTKFKPEIPQGERKQTTTPIEGISLDPLTSEKELSQPTKTNHSKKIEKSNLLTETSFLTTEIKKENVNDKDSLNSKKINARVNPENSLSQVNEPYESSVSDKASKSETHSHKDLVSVPISEPVEKSNEKLLHLNDREASQTSSQAVPSSPTDNTTLSQDTMANKADKNTAKVSTNHTELVEPSPAKVEDKNVISDLNLHKKADPNTTETPLAAPKVSRRRQNSRTKRPKIFDHAKIARANLFSSIKKKQKPESHARHNSNYDELDLSSFDVKERWSFGFNVFLNVARKILVYIFLIALLGAAGAGGTAFGYFASLVANNQPPTKEKMYQEITQLDQLSTLYYNDGKPIANVQSDVVRSLTKLKEISPLIINGLIATEDEYFYQHQGVIPKAIIRATIQEVLSPGTGTGGSTLTQQLVKQQMLNNEVTFSRKANEILLALRLENHFSKDEILEAYLNVSPFGRNNSGENVAGIAKAAEGIFGKKANEVNLAQAAYLVGMPQDPYSYTPYDQFGRLKKDLSPGIKRMKEVLFRMYRSEKINKAEYEQAKNYDISKDFLPSQEANANRESYLYQTAMHEATEQLMRMQIEKDGGDWDSVYAKTDLYNQYYQKAENQLKTGGYKVYTTIDKQIYDQLQASAQKHQNELGATYDGVYTDPQSGKDIYYVESVQSGMVVMDNTSGKVLGFVAGFDYKNNQVDHAFKMRRSPGSTIKPLAVYGPAIEENLINPATIIPDTAYQHQNADGTLWEPTNYGQSISNGFESARTALSQSHNLPTIRIYESMINQKVDIGQYLKNMGFSLASSYPETDIQNLAFSIGGTTTGPTVFEQTRAFSTIANQGQYTHGHIIEKIEDNKGQIIFSAPSKPTQVFSEDTNYLLLDMLRDTLKTGTGVTAANSLTMGGDWIAKTGTSEDAKDLWFMAATPKISVGTWIGYDNRYNQYQFDINDGFGSEGDRIQRYWANVMNELYAVRPEIFGTEERFQQPMSVTQTPIVEFTGTLPGFVNIDGRSINIKGPLKEELFKVSHPAKELSYEDVLFAASQEDLTKFWSDFRAKLAEQERQEQLKKQKEKLKRDKKESEDGSSSSDSSNKDESQNSQNESSQSTKPGLSF